MNRVRQELNQSQSILDTTVLELDSYVGDWTAIGRLDAEKGQTFNNRSKQCRQFGHTVDPALYEQGYRLGLAAYCTADNGRVQGELGQPYLGICPAASEDDFLDGYAPAYEAYQRAKLRQELEAELADADAELSTLTTTIDELTARLDTDGLSRNERLQLISQIADLSGTEQDLRRERDLVAAHRQCLTDDWQGLGLEHGLAGQDNQLNRLDCRRFGLSPATTDYAQGLSQGLQRWCSYDRGYAHALAMEPQSRVCTSRGYQPYRSGYLEGLAERDRQQTILELKAEKLDLQEQQTEQTDELAVINLALSGDSLDPVQKQRYERRRARLQQSLQTLAQRLQTIDQTLANLEN